MSSVKGEHYHSVMAVFREMKRVGFICDVKLKVENDTILAHRALLAASSNYFVEKFFQRESVEESVIEFHGLEPFAISACIEFIYGSDPYVNMENVGEMLRAATLLELHGLIKLCAQYLEQSISLSTCLQIRDISQQYNFLSVVKAAENFSIQNFELVIRASGFQGLDFPGFMQFFRTTTHYWQKWLAMLSWTKGNFTERSQFLPEILDLILREKCPFNFVFNMVWRENLVKTYPGCDVIIACAVFEAFESVNVNEFNCFELLEMGRNFAPESSASAMDAIRDFIAGNFEYFCQTEGFKCLESTDLFRILQSPNAVFYPANLKWGACTMWIKCDLQNRKKHLRKIMGKIAWNGCSFLYYLTQVYGDFLVKKSKSCTSLAASRLSDLMSEGDITVSNWYTLLEIALKHDDVWNEDATRRILHFGSMNFQELISRPTFGKLRLKELLTILKSPAVQASRPEIQWEGAMRWVKKEIQIRHSDLEQILECLDMSNWPFDFLFGVVFRELIIQESSACHEAVTWALLSVLRDENISISNCFELLNIAKTSGPSSQAVSKVQAFLVMNYEQISKCQEFNALEESDIYCILDSELFDQYNEDLKWTPIYNWVLHDATRIDCLWNVLVKLNIESFSFRFVDTKVYSQQLIRDMPGCKELCLSSMLSNLKYSDISLVNWFDLLNLAKNNEHDNSGVVLIKIHQFMAANFSQIRQQAYFEKLQKEELLTILNSPEIISATEEERFQGITDWIKGGDDRKESFIEIIRSFKLTDFPFELLYIALQKEPLVKESNECSELFLSALQCVLKCSNITDLNWHVLLNMAKESGEMRYAKIVTNVLKHIAIKFANVHTQEEYKELSYENLVSVLRAPELKVKEETKAKAVMTWVTSDGFSRENKLPDLFAFIKLEQLSKSCLHNKIYLDPMVKRSQRCHDMIVAALCNENTVENHSTTRPQKRDMSYRMGNIPNGHDKPK